MGSGEKFLELENYFRSCTEGRMSLTFDEMERILKFPLCPSAYNFEAYWYLGKTHTFPYAWINGGYKLDSLDLKGKKASFIKNNENEANMKFESITKPTVNRNVKENAKTKIKIDFVTEKINKYNEEINTVINARYKSWEHCYKYFKENKDKSFDESVIDTLCLHLAFYLASWGMYRGSSFLLQKDYKVHHEAVLEILKEKYKPLWNIKCADILKNDNLDLIFMITDELKTIYVKKREDIDKRINVSDILITKILMGTFGCVPAYDRFFISGLKEYKVASGNYNKKSIINLAEYYIEQNETFEKCRKEVSPDELDYPQMKLIDMCFWQIGYDKSDEAGQVENEEV